MRLPASVQMGCQLMWTSSTACRPASTCSIARLQRAGEIVGSGDGLRPRPARLGDESELRARRERGERHDVGLGGIARGVQAGHRLLHRAVSGVVEDHGEDGDAVRLGDVVGGDRVGEQVRPVAHRRHDETVRIGELHAERARQPPAEPARVRLLPPRVVLGEAELVERGAELGDHGRSPAADRGADRGRHRRLGHRRSIDRARVGWRCRRRSQLAAHRRRSSRRARSSRRRAPRGRARSRSRSTRRSGSCARGTGCTAGSARAGSPGSRRGGGARRASTGRGCRPRARRRPRRATGPGPGRRTSGARRRSRSPPPTTGTPGSTSARRCSASAAKPSCEPAPRWAMISGRAACVRQVRAARARSSGCGASDAGAIAGGASSASAGHGSHNTSRGRLRYTGPFGVLVAIA